MSIETRSNTEHSDAMTGTHFRHAPELALGRQLYLHPNWDVAEQLATICSDLIVLEKPGIVYLPADTLEGTAAMSYFNDDVSTAARQIVDEKLDAGKIDISVEQQVQVPVCGLFTRVWKDSFGFVGATIRDVETSRYESAGQILGEKIGLREGYKLKVANPDVRFDSIKHEVRLAIIAASDEPIVRQMFIDKGWMYPRRNYAMLDPIDIIGSTR